MLGITMGDPNGIGPEIIRKYLKEAQAADIVVFGNKAALGNIEAEVVDPYGKLKEFEKGRPTAEAGKASYAYIREAINQAKENKITAVITAPINKETLKLAGINYSGHTEIFADETKTKDYAMMFWSPELKVILTTIHKPLAAVPELITKESFTKTVRMAVLGLRNLGIGKPRIGVAGLNPHAGENGVIGREELEVIAPVIKAFQAKGLDIAGPYPADTLFIPENRKRFDIIIAHYHDQGLIPIKMLAFDSAVNITVGLPIVRTSVDHGTAYDIAGKNIASINSLKNAVEVAKKIAKSFTP
jgi:4-hydroxythreonine-4-phosphate dehydrogenase